MSNKCTAHTAKGMAMGNTGSDVLKGADYFIIILQVYLIIKALILKFLWLLQKTAVLHLGKYTGPLGLGFLSVSAVRDTSAFI
ncbi:MAG: hypothetical protein LBS81_00440 [Endomicrobium sp.]|jgi:hypothetical protein|nr:hypothetical protein [Endomicrobium sp.]